jgi:hypothetical protein
MLRALFFLSMDLQMKQALVFLLGGTWFCAVAVAVAADDAALQRCRDLRDAPARLACYDAIPLTSPTTSTAPSAAPAAAPAAIFGFEARPAPTAPPQTESIESAIDGPFDGWLPRGQLKLANGQVWEVTDGSTTAYNLKSPRVKLTRGVSGTFFMAIEGVSQTPRVRRVR